MNAKYFLLLVMISRISLVGYAQEKSDTIFQGVPEKIFEIKTNTLRSDFGPAVVGDTLYFTTYSDKILGEPDQKLRKSAFYDLYKAAIDKNGNTISKREPLFEFLTKYHDGPVSYCEKTGELFVTQSDNVAAAKPTEKSVRDTIKLRIVIARRVNGKWTDIVNFPYNNPAYNVGHPAISITGDTLVFSSDKKGGFGATDLYYSVRKDGKWSLPENMGANINTSGKEEFSFLTHNSTGGCFLVFASTGRFGLGGLDLYYTRFPVNNSKIIHFDPPINTVNDDFGMVIPPDREFGYLTSNRPGTGNDDIYKFTFKKPVIKPFIGILSPVKELYVFNRKTRSPISSGLVRSCDKQVYLSDQRGEVDMLTKSNENCEVFASKLGYKDVSKILVAKILKAGEVNRDTIWMEPAFGKNITLNNIYYDFDKWDILPEAAKELDILVSFMNENPDLKVILSSHTDSRGDDNYNLKLSQRRAEAAVNYIVAHGIQAGRITGIGYGETRLVNKCANGVDCTPQEHRQNRRTEIFIPEFGKALDILQTEGQYSGKAEKIQPKLPEKNSNAKSNSGNIPKIENKINKTPKKPSADLQGTFKTEKLVNGNTERSTVSLAGIKNTQKPDNKPIEKPKIQNKMVDFTPGTSEEINSTKKMPPKETKHVDKSENKVIGKDYFVIIKSFPTKSLAEKFVSEINGELAGVSVIQEYEPYRVGFKHKNFKESQAARDKFLEKYPDCWILQD